MKFCFFFINFCQTQKYGIINQFFYKKNIHKLNYFSKLIKDSMKNGAVLVTTGQQVSLNDVRKEINFCRKTKVPIVGVVENMRQLKCTKCGHCNPLFNVAKGQPLQKMLNDYKIDLLGGLTFSPKLLQISEAGQALFLDELSENEICEGMEDPSDPDVILKNEVRKEFEVIFDQVVNKMK